MSKRIHDVEHFHNPYTFVPALSREGVTGELGDCPPVGHGRLYPDRWAGRISVKVNTVTPLLVLDASRRTTLVTPRTEKEAHYQFPVLVDQGLPMIPVTGLKGVIRAAYEAVTNSRLSIFEEHDTPLTYSQWVGGKIKTVRKQYAVAPEALLPTRLHPASSYEELSPADRVFGWVGRGGAYRGNVRLHRIQCIVSPASGAVKTFSSPLPLAVLSAPRPTYARFYAGSGSWDAPKPLDSSLQRDHWYAKNQVLRGRKFYPHHAGLPEGHWDLIAHRTQEVLDGIFQEYRRPWEAIDKRGTLTSDKTAFEVRKNREQLDNQNRSITGWVNPGVVFESLIDVVNLSDVELGALLWLLDLPTGCHLRMGYGKPLGFGSVRLEVDYSQTRLEKVDLQCEDGHDLIAERRRVFKERYSFRTPRPSSAIDELVAKCISSFEMEVAKVYKYSFPEVPFIKAFIAAASGDPNYAIHYPRVRPSEMDRNVPVPPDPRGRSFEWFARNERQKQPTSLPEAGGGPLEIYVLPKPKNDP